MTFLSEVRRRDQDCAGETLGTVSSMVAFNIAAKDAQVLRREFLEETPEGLDARPVAAERFVTLKRGQAMARLGTGAYAVPLPTPAPLPDPPAWQAEEVRNRSWERYGASLLGGVPEKVGRNNQASADETFSRMTVPRSERAAF